MGRAGRNRRGAGLERGAVHRAWLSLALGALAASGLLAQLGEVRHLAIQPPDVVWLSAGEFAMGASDHELVYAIELCLTERAVPIRSLAPSTDGACAARRFVTEAPARSVWTPAFGIDRTEVTHEAWRRCVRAGRCPPSRIPDDDLRLAAPRMPVTGVTWDEAAEYCRFVGGRLPTEVEWERAARGNRRHRFPWGRYYNSGLANHGRSPEGPDARDGFALAAPVGSFPDGASPHGLLDAAGNAWEWTASPPREEDLGPGADPSVYRVVRGGSWAQPPEALRVTHRFWVPTAEARSDVGLRCAYDAR